MLQLQPKSKPVAVASDYSEPKVGINQSSAESGSLREVVCSFNIFFKIEILSSMF
jgi:hypothetical protein